MKLKFLFLALFAFGVAITTWSQASLNPKLIELTAKYHGRLIVLDHSTNAIAASWTTDEDIIKMQDNLKVINENITKQKQTNKNNQEQITQLQRDVQSLKKENSELRRDLTSQNREMDELKRNVEELRGKIK